MNLNAMQKFLPFNFFFLRLCASVDTESSIPSTRTLTSISKSWSCFFRDFGNPRLHRNETLTQNRNTTFRTVVRSPQRSMPVSTAAQFTGHRRRINSERTANTTAPFNNTESTIVTIENVRQH